MTKKTPKSPDDQAVFRDAMKGVKPLKQPNKVQLRDEPTLKSKRRAPERSDEAPPLSDHQTETVGFEGALSFKQDGIQDRQFRKLRQGQMPQEAILDLHGQTVEQARIALYRFIQDCSESNLRCIRIIHGKGRGTKQDAPVLKNRVNTWLRQLPQILAFHSCQPRDGGTGAVYVLLKRH